MIDKLLWYDYDKPCFIVSEEKEKNIRGNRKAKLERKRGRRRNKKVSPVLGPALIQQTGGGGGGVCPGPEGRRLHSDFLSFYR